MWCHTCFIYMGLHSTAEKKRQLAITKVKKECTSWPTHQFKVIGGGQISIRLPSYLNSKNMFGKKWADCENDPETTGEFLSFMGIQSTETLQTLRMIVS